jgi:NhaP-type Na+/H+ or K+/H+ antiporter
MTPFQIIDWVIVLLSQIFRFLGMAILGLGIGWLTLDLLKKIEIWQGQVIIFLGLIGLIIAMTVFTGWGALGAFAIGIGVAIFLWGLPKKEKKVDEKTNP